MRRLTDGEREIRAEQERDARAAEEHSCRHRGPHYSAAHSAWCVWSEAAGACLPIPNDSDDDLPF